MKKCILTILEKHHHWKRTWKGSIDFSCVVLKFDIVILIMNGSSLFVTLAACLWSTRVRKPMTRLRIVRRISSSVCVYIQIRIVQPRKKERTKINRTAKGTEEYYIWNQNISSNGHFPVESKPNHRYAWIDIIVGLSIAIMEWTHKREVGDYAQTQDYASVARRRDSSTGPTMESRVDPWRANHFLEKEFLSSAAM